MTSSFLFSSDQLEYALHLLLSPVTTQQVFHGAIGIREDLQNLDFACTVVKPAFFVILRLQDRSLQRFPLSHNRNASVTR